MPTALHSSRHPAFDATRGTQARARLAGWASLAALLLILAGCASAPPAGGRAQEVPGPRPAIAADAARQLPPQASAERDGVGANPPADLLQTPDAEPRIEPVPSGGANKPYEVLGQAYVPLKGDPELVQRGLASWYGRKFHGRSTANGETFNMYAMTAAHRTMPLPSYARVRNPANGREVVVRINDRGPFHGNRVIDLSYTAALKLGVLSVATVEIERITYEAIRAGAGTGRGSATLLAATPAQSLSSPPAPEPGPVPPPQQALALAPPAEPATVVPSEAPAPLPVAAKSARGFWLQLGAFAQRDGAFGFQQRVATEADWLAPLMAIFNERNLHRLQAGPFTSRGDAVRAAERLRQALRLMPTVVERR